nr:CD225/dispanin family protein [Stenotrophomonas sp.]
MVIFFPPGIVATIHACRVSSQFLAGNVERANASSRKALRWSVASLLTMPALLVALVAYALPTRAFA